ncbi:hypothetical protein EVAR_51364_1 [Eumeta japonica]|uniref:Uncharacterized protein n=1 Tax=Eumeta variegata TaxID=151549 RepID=A0A4C1Y5J7_EUMVA|nr:hypothetical protein EVAR_51364_1 [Eumeta japonica]
MYNETESFGSGRTSTGGNVLRANFFTASDVDSNILGHDKPATAVMEGSTRSSGGNSVDVMNLGYMRITPKLNNSQRCRHNPNNRLQALERSVGRLCGGLRRSTDAPAALRTSSARDADSGPMLRLALP